MKYTLVLIVCLGVSLVGKVFPGEIDYASCQSIEDVIALETIHIEKTHSFDHEDLANLHVCRGESYLLNNQYKNAVEDFKIANSHLGYATNSDGDMILAFRSAFGEAVGYDNLGMMEESLQSLEQLQVIANHVGCSHCLENNRCQQEIVETINKKTLPYKIVHCVNLSKDLHNFQHLIVKCKKNKDPKQMQPNSSSGVQNNASTDNYDDILGPIQPPDSDWCKEVVVGVGAAMEVIAMRAPTPWIKGALMGTIAALTTRATRCCDAGGFWKACVSPITRKWKDWNDRAKVFTYPNQSNLDLYTN